MREYVKLILFKYVKPHLTAGAFEVHVVFDYPGGLGESPKEIEQRRRDQTRDQTDKFEHKCTTLSSASPVPKNWRSLLSCRNCKENLTAYVGEELLELGPSC